MLLLWTRREPRREGSSEDGHYGPTVSVMCVFVLSQLNRVHAADGHCYASRRRYCATVRTGDQAYCISARILKLISSV